MPVFGYLDSSINLHHSFWQPLPTDFSTASLCPSHMGQLQVAEGDNDIEFCQLALVGSQLYKYHGDWTDPTHIEVVELKWKVADLFFEETETENIYGFSLKGKDSITEFYADSPEELSGWLDQLSEICILSGFENEFDVLHPIGEGSTAKIYSVMSSADRSLYAAKRLSKSALNDNPLMIAAVKNEIEALRKVKHKNVMKMYRVYDLPEDICVILEHLPYGTLASRLRARKKLSELTACKIIWALLDTVEHLHKQGIIHRDLKLENILMASEHDDTDFRVADFGLAVLDTREVHSLRSGSPGYMAPEILDNKLYGSKVDMFSIGVILYSMLTGKLPFDAPKVTQIIELNKKCKIDYNSAELQSVSVSALGVLKALTNANPRSRPCASNAKNSFWFISQSVPRIHISPVKNPITPRRHLIIRSPSIFDVSPQANYPLIPHRKVITPKRLLQLISPKFYSPQEEIRAHPTKTSKVRSKIFSFEREALQVMCNLEVTARSDYTTIRISQANVA